MEPVLNKIIDALQLSNNLKLDKAAFIKYKYLAQADGSNLLLAALEAKKLNIEDIKLIVKMDEIDVNELMKIDGGIHT